jgi:hypothetical protein
VNAEALQDLPCSSDAGMKYGNAKILLQRLHHIKHAYFAALNIDAVCARILLVRLIVL